MIGGVLAGRAVPRVGLGCMGMSEFYGTRDDERSLSVMRLAYQLGCRHFDTADMYGLGHNEALLGRLLTELGPARAELQVATKVGIIRDPAAKYAMSVDASRSHIQRACEASLLRLGIEQIGLYYLHRQDSRTPIAESIDALAALVKQGKVAAIGLCEVDASTLQVAHRVHPIAAVQSEYSLWSRDVELEVAPLCASLGIPLVAFSPLGRGMLSGSLSKSRVAALDPDQDLRPHLPRFQGKNLDANLRLVAQLREIASRLGEPPARVALAWLLGRGSTIHVIPGSTSEQHLATNLSAEQLILPPWAVLELELAFSPEAVSGSRYPSQSLSRRGPPQEDS